jgi:hypothetical protein
MQGGTHTHQRRQDFVRHRKDSSGSGARRMMAEGMDVLLCRGTDVWCLRRHPMARTKRWCGSSDPLWAACIVSQSKPVQVCETEIMICDKRQHSWRRGSSPDLLHKRPVFCPDRARAGWQGQHRYRVALPGMVALAKPIVTSDAPVVRRCMGSRTPCCATTAYAAWHVSRGW